MLIQNRNLSIGLFALNNGKIVHFTRTLDRNNKTTTLGIELFESDGKYIGYSPIVDNSLANDSVFDDEFLWIDKDNQLYVRSYKNGYPIIRIVRLVYQGMD